MEKVGMATEGTIGKMAIVMNKIIGGVLDGSLNPETILRCLNEILEHSVPVFRHDMRKEGWKLITDRMDINYPIPRLEIMDIPEPESNIPTKGYTLRECLDKITGQYSVLSQHQAEYLLANAALIPESWKKKQIFFTGTVWSDNSKELRIPFMQWALQKRASGHWEISFRKLDGKNISVIEIWNYVVPRLVENATP